MKTVILCGGKGTRIRDVSSEIPKPMIPIGEYPVVKHIMDTYSLYGFQEFILCLGFKGWKIKEYFLNFRAGTADITIDMAQNGAVTYNDAAALPPWKVTLAETGLEAMTGCRIKRIQRHVGDNPFLLTYGDGVGDINVAALVEFHRSHGKLITITSVRPPARFGELVVEGNQVTSFQEKPQAAGGYINGGFFVCEPGVCDYVSDDEACTFER
ncbi:MAG TPA: sugar phosphate nucleotidyltransferase, partial [Candidatus Hydrogenedentes bacterium]|nr:sugar phosphate nucleotidyltransferase [Candidatus Hydrogenedentota bacterium]